MADFEIGSAYINFSSKGAQSAQRAIDSLQGGLRSLTADANGFGDTYTEKLKNLNNLYSSMGEKSRFQKPAGFSGDIGGILGERSNQAARQRQIIDEQAQKERYESGDRIRARAMAASDADFRDEAAKKQSQYEEGDRIRSRAMAASAADERQFAAAQRDSNLLRAQATQLIREVSTAQERHNQRVMQYNEMLKIGALNQRQYNLAVQKSANAMKSEGRGFNNQFIYQASFAVQDIATVASMQGMRMSDIFRGASNNVSQMMMSLKGVSPLMIGVAGASVAIGAALAQPMWDYWTQGAKHAKDAANDVEHALSRLESALKRVADQSSRKAELGQLFKEGTAKQVETEVRKIQTTIETTKAQVKAAKDAEEFRRGELQSSGLDFTSAAVAGGMTVGRDIQGALGTRTLGVEMGLSGVNTYSVDAVMRYFADLERNGEMTDLLRRIQEAYIRGLASLTEQDEAVMKARQARIDAEQLLAKSTKELAEAEKQAVLAPNRDSRKEFEKAGQRELEDIKKTQASGTKTVDDMEREAAASRRVLLEKETKSGVARDEARRKFDAALEDKFTGIEATTPEEKANIDRARLGQIETQELEVDDEIKKLRDQNKRKFEPNFTDFGDFGRQFQMMVSRPEDEAKKQRDKQINLLEQERDHLREIRDTLKGGIPAMAG